MMPLAMAQTRRIGCGVGPSLTECTALEKGRTRVTEAPPTPSLPLGPPPRPYLAGANPPAQRPPPSLSPLAHPSCARLPPHRAAQGPASPIAANAIERASPPVSGFPCRRLHSRRYHSHGHKKKKKGAREPGKRGGTRDAVS